MKRNIIFSILFILMIIETRAAVIGMKEFAVELKTNQELIVLDVLAPDVYAKQHVKGAINLPHKDLYKVGGYEGQLKEPAELARILGEKGISNTSLIIVYDDGSQKYNSRVWWILKYLGATNVHLLHKEMGEMEQFRIPLTNTPTSLKPTTFIVNLNESMNISLAELKVQIGKPELVLLDAREKDEFVGADKDKRSNGHLPGAVWMNFKEVLTGTGDFKSKEELVAVTEKFGITQEKQIVVYCQTGIKAATLYVALHELAGFDNIRLYAGAYAEWASNPENPLVK